jgi:hypothetical protein
MKQYLAGVTGRAFCLDRIAGTHGGGVLIVCSFSSRITAGQVISAMLRLPR